MAAFEDEGYFCVDNLPPEMIRSLAELFMHEGSKVERAAVVSDARGGSYFAGLVAVLDELEHAGRQPPRAVPGGRRAVAARRATRRRAAATRSRRAAASRTGSRASGMLLAPVRERADLVIETTGLTSAMLRRKLADALLPTRAPGRLAVTIQSFGFKHGPARDADLLFDVRFLPNPHYEPELRPQTGLEPAVVAYIDRDGALEAFYERLHPMLDYLLPQYVAEGKAHLSIAVGCTGGRHRSVAIAEHLAARYRESGEYLVEVTHRDIDRAGRPLSDEPSDPIARVARWFAEAEAAGVEQPDAMTLATATPDGRPSARVVLLKGIDARGFAFFTNYESRKARELDGNPRAALVLHWRALHRQVRVDRARRAADGGGVRRLLRDAPARQPAGRLGLAAEPAAAGAAPSSSSASRRSRPSTRRRDVPRPPHWGGYRVEPDEIELWQGRANRLHDRIGLRADDGRLGTHAPPALNRHGGGRARAAGILAPCAWGCRARGRQRVLPRAAADDGDARTRPRSGARRAGGQRVDRHSAARGLRPRPPPPSGAPYDDGAVVTQLLDAGISVGFDEDDNVIDAPPALEAITDQPCGCRARAATSSCCWSTSAASTSSRRRATTWPTASRRPGPSNVSTSSRTIFRELLARVRPRATTARDRLACRPRASRSTPSSSVSRARSSACSTRIPTCAS